VRLFATADAERQAVVEQIRAWLSQGVPPDAICIAARTGWLLDQYRRPLIDAGVAVVNLDAQGEVGEGGVRLSTLHRLKGTEFSRVLLASVQEDVFPMRQKASQHADIASIEDFLAQERCLMYVASTRARDELVIMGSGRPSPFAVPAAQETG
jgi:superfamily I DNA/RNA helicase